MPGKHTYRVSVTWTGNSGSGTSGYTSYGRSHEISAPEKASIAGSSDPAFRGDRSRWSPEDLLVASLSACHKLWYLHLCSDAGVVVLEYVDEAEGTMEESGSGGRFVNVTLRPKVTIDTSSDCAQAIALHRLAHEKCYIANSVRFPVLCEPSIAVASA